MTDEPPVDDLSAEEHEAVSRLLSEARADGAVPPRVAARLDEALEGLAAEGPPPSRAHGAGRSRRLAGAVLIAAAAVVVAGVGIVQYTNRGEGADTLSADSAHERSGTAEAPEASASKGSPNAEGEPSLTSGQAAALPKVSIEHFRDDASRVLNSRPQARTLSGTSAEALPTQSTAPTDADPRSTPPTPPAAGGPTGCAVLEGLGDDGTAYPVTLDGAPGVLWVHVERDGSRLVSGYACAGDAGPLASTHLAR